MTSTDRANKWTRIASNEWTNDDDCKQWTNKRTNQQRQALNERMNEDGKQQRMNQQTNGGWLQAMNEWTNQRADSVGGDMCACKLSQGRKTFGRTSTPNQVVVSFGSVVICSIDLYLLSMFPSPHCCIQYIWFDNTKNTMSLAIISHCYCTVHCIIFGTEYFSLSHTSRGESMEGFPTAILVSPYRVVT